MKICICSATGMEVLPIIAHLNEHFNEFEPSRFIRGELEVDVLITGVGNAQTIYSLTKYLQFNRPDLCIQAGIAGTFRSDWKIGDVYLVIEQIEADLGIEQADGRFKSVFEMGLIDPSSSPYTNGALMHSTGSEMQFLPTAKGITLNTVSGSFSTIESLRNRYHADLESMEGAGFFYVCLREQVSFMEIRSISNQIEERNRDRWNIPLAVENLNAVLIEMISGF